MKVMVDVEQPVMKSAMSMSPQDVTAKVLELNDELISKNMQQTLDKLSEILSRLKVKGDNCKISEAKFTLSLGAGAEASLLSVVKGNISATAGIEFTITF